MSLRTFSNGGGVQSTAALVLSAERRIDFPVHLFANVGDDSEHPDTLAYVRDVAIPYAAQHGIEFVELKRHKRDGSVETLVGRIYGAARSIPIPARMSNGAPGRRTCTSDFKIRVVAKWLKQHGATAAAPALTGLGISLDEFHRARTDSGIEWQALAYPLIDLRLTRKDCEKIITAAGLPVPPKSSCYFCPFHNRQTWQALKRTRPDLFEKAVAIENHINDKRGAIGKDAVRLHPSNTPLSGAVGDQLTMWRDDDMENCESGYCHT